MMRFFLTMLLAATLATAANAQSIRGDITVNADVVTLGDLVTDAGAAADIPVFRAPQIGQSGNVSTSRIIEAAERHGVFMSTPSISRVTIHRAARRISQGDVMALLEAAYEASGLRPNEDIVVDFSLRGLDDDIVMDAGFTGDPTVTGFAIDPRNGQFSATLEVDDGKRAFRKSLAGAAIYHRDMPVFAATLPRDTIISEADIRMERRRLSAADMTAHESDVMTMADVIGMATRRRVAANTMVRTRDVMSPRLVRRNEVVTAVYALGPIQVTTKMRALADGPLGATVPALNMKSKRIIDAEVIGHGLVRVTPAAAPGLASRDLAALSVSEERTR